MSLRPDRKGLTASIAALSGALVQGRGSSALADQIMVSGSNFAANVVLVRALGLADYGKYSIAYVLLLYANALQMSLVASPMLSLAPTLAEPAKRRFVEGMLALQVLASLAVSALFAAAGMGARLFTDFYSTRIVIAFALCAGTFQLQDWLRRYYFLYGKGRLAIGCDFVSYVVQFALYALLWRTHSLTLFRVFLIMFLTSGAALAFGPATDALRPGFARIRESRQTSRTLSRGLLLANQVRWLGVQGVLLIGTGIVGTAAAGGLRATQNLAGPVYLLLISLENFVPVRMAETLQATGAAGAYRYARRAIVLGCTFFTLIVLPIGLLGRTILSRLYGPALVVFYVPMLLQLVAILFQIPANMWVFLYRGLGQTRVLVHANLLSAAFSLGLVYLLGRTLGPSGIVLASLTGAIGAVVYYAFYWSRHSGALERQHPAPSTE